MNDSKEKGNVLEYMIDFFSKNVIILLKARPKVRMIYSKDGGSFSPEGEVTGGIDNFLQLIDELRAYNTSIALNCFSLLEASFECYLLHHLDVKNLEGIQKQIMLKHIRDVLKLSNIDNYSKEFEFITSKKLNSFFSTEENECFQLIRSFYVVRNILSHGSAMMAAYIPIEKGGRIEIDETDKEYIDLLKKLESKLKMKIYNKHMNVRDLMHINDVVDLLVESTFIASAKFTKEIDYGAKLLISKK
jgi:flagellar motor switch/type III secretory pathway protein FliN